MSRTNNVPWMRIAAEGTAIVVSILLAFSIDAWWGDRNERMRERQVLSALLVELGDNRRIVDEATSIYEQTYRDVFSILDMIEARPAEIDETVLVPLLRNVLAGQTFHLESGTYDGLIAAGELKLVRDDELRAMLAAWPSIVAEWTEEVDIQFRFVRDVMNPYVAERARLRGIGLSLEPFPGSDVLPGLSPSPTGAELGTESLESTGFENLLVLDIEALWYAIRDGKILVTTLSEVEGRIRQYLQQ